MTGFFVTGEAARRRHEEIAERDRLHHEKQTVEAKEIEEQINTAAGDVEAARLIEMARFIDPDSWRSREEWLRMAERERSGRQANTPDGQRHVERALNMAALAVGPSLRRARKAIDMVRGWS